MDVLQIVLKQCIPLGTEQIRHGEEKGIIQTTRTASCPTWWIISHLNAKKKEQGLVLSRRIDNNLFVKEAKFGFLLWE